MRQVLLFSVLLLFQFKSHAIPYDPNTPQGHSVLGLSSAIMDHFFMISDAELELITNEKGSWTPIDYPTLCSILDKNPDASKMTPGGSGANVIKGLAQLGEQCALIGKIGGDDKGEYYSKVMRSLGVGTYLQKGNKPTGQAICFVTPDGNRTFHTYLGASYSLTDLKLNAQMFQKVRLFYLEGWQLVDQDLVMRALKMAKNAGVKIAINLDHVKIVRDHKDFILSILEPYIDLIFCDHRQAQELTGLSPKKASSYLSKMCSIAVVTMSQRGSWTQQGAEQCYTQALSVNPIDVTGECSFFTSGFLYGYLQGYSPKKCAWLGALVSSYVVKRIGAEIDAPIWSEIRQRISANNASFDNL